MTLSEFKAWFSGFTEMMDGPPNADQWSRIVAKIATIDDKPIPVTVYREYVERFRPFWPGVHYGAAQPMLTAGALPRNGGMDHAIPDVPSDASQIKNLGRAEFRSMTT